MISSRRRIVVSFLSGSMLMWFIMTMVAQQSYISHKETRKSGSQRKDIDSFVEIGAESKWTGKFGKKPMTDVSQRDHLGKVRLLCWVMTCPDNLEYKAGMIARTWAKRCPQTLYMSSQKNPTFPGTVVGHNVKEGRKYLWNKTRMSLEYIYRHHFNDADWFFKADDDTYVIVENLMAFLSTQDASEPVRFGFNFNPKDRDYMSGGAGFVLSKEALRRFVEEGLPDRSGKCPDKLSKRPGDKNLGKCMESLGVRPGDSRDRSGRFRFFPVNIEYFLDKNTQPLEWLHRYSKYNITKGQNCCSDSLISIHYVTPKDMLEYDFLIYNLKVGLLE